MVLLPQACDCSVHLLPSFVFTFLTQFYVEMLICYHWLMTFRRRREHLVCICARRVSLALRLPHGVARIFRNPCLLTQNEMRMPYLAVIAWICKDFVAASLGMWTGFSISSGCALQEFGCDIAYALYSVLVILCTHLAVSMESKQVLQ